MSGSRPTDLAGKRVLVVGADSETGRAIAAGLAEAGANLALVAAKGDATAAYGVQRLSRQLGAPGHRVVHQAIDAANEMAVRVMVRQMGKELRGLDAAVFCADLADETSEALSFALRYAVREMAHGGRGVFVVAAPPAGELRVAAPVGNVQVRMVEAGKLPEDVAREVVSAIAAG
jgi:NAD(P)-dependent dehydrogenase (short-subunit alcohol dehydrogenase family)